MDRRHASGGDAAPEHRGTTDARLFVLFVAHIRLYRDGVVAALAQRQGLSVAGAAGRADALRRATDPAPDVVVVDVATPDSLNLVRDVRRCFTSTRVLAFAVDESTSDIVRYAEAGAVGYVASDRPIDALVEAIRRVALDEAVCSPRVTVQLMRRIAESHAHPRPAAPDRPTLTRREVEVLHQVTQGRSNKEIAVALNLSESTVKNHVHHVLEKLGASTRTHAVALAHRQSFDTPWMHALPVPAFRGEVERATV